MRPCIKAVYRNILLSKLKPHEISMDNFENSYANLYVFRFSYFLGIVYLYNGNFNLKEMDRDVRIAFERNHIRGIF